MQSLYSNGLEHVYDAMYQTFIDYDDEYTFYNHLISKLKAKSVLEIGCGTGNLANRFINNKHNYIGLDLSYDMIKLSQNKNPNGNFIQGDVTNFKIGQKVDCILITGRTTSYLLENTELNNAINSISKNLNSEGLLIFDFIDASRFFKIINHGKEVTHNATFFNKTYSRDSFMKVNLDKNNFMFDWKSTYYEITNSKKTIIAEDQSTVRAFTLEEWKIYLELNNYKIIEIIDRKSYAFDTYVIVAKKISE